MEKLLKISTLFISILILFLNCNNKNEKANELNKIRLTTIESNDIDTLISKDSLTGYSIVIDNRDYKIMNKLYTDEVGGLVVVCNKKQNKIFSIDEGASYYKDILDSFIIIDAGTSSLRSFSIYNLNSLKKMFSTVYDGRLDLNKKERSITFYTPVEINDSLLRPKCTDEILNSGNGFGYLEEQIINFDNQMLIKTGTFECFMLE